MILTRSRRWAALGATLAITAACGGSGGSGQPDHTPVVATTSIWADVTSEVACGAEIPALIPTGADPHTFEPSLRDRATVDRASTVVANGLDLEASLHDLLDDADAVVVELAADVDVLEPHHDEGDHDEEDHDADDHDDHEGQDDHGHSGEGDPHFWQDPRRVAGTLDTIASALSAAGIDTCTDEYRRQLEDLDAEILELLAPVPTPSRILVTSHDSLAYFADRYGFEVVGTVIPSTSTLAETNASDLAELAAEIEARGVRAIFTEELESTADADALAARLGVAVVPLTTDALTDSPDADTYLEMMRSNAAKIAAALAP